MAGSKYDAFGNPTDRSPLAGVPGGDKPAFETQVEPAGQPQPTSMRDSIAWDSANGTPGSNGRSGAATGAVALMVFALLLSGVAIGAYALIS